METDLNKRYQTMIVLWFALLMSVAMYFLVSVFVPPRTINDSNPSGSVVMFALTALGTFLVIISFAVKNKLLQRSVDRQELGLVQQAMIIACALCEAGALLGLVEYFIVSSREYYLLLAIAAGGIALHFPRRSQLEAASYQSRNTLTK